MATTWNCLYLPSDDAGAVVQRLQDSLTNLGYILYNPFGLIPVKAYPRSVRLFVAPAAEGWVKVIGTPDAAQLSALSQNTTVIYMALDGTGADIWVYVDGEAVAIENALIPFLRPNLTANDLHDALHTTSKLIQMDKPDSGLPFDALPDDIKTLAGKVNTHQAQKMFNRLSGDLLKKVSKDGDQADAARALINNSDTLDWNSMGGTRIRAVMNCLTLPDNWREPDFNMLRDAYPLYERRRRSPNARIYPGDQEIMAKVADALLYTPVYGGTN
ncbi:MAG: hypothetical protein GC179_12460 [Anaerolineaceae bacterium]|nr:hypothetical protein [Anaerolineaceae bacterium]